MIIVSESSIKISLQCIHTKKSFIFVGHNLLASIHMKYYFHKLVLHLKNRSYAVSKDSVTVAIAMYMGTKDKGLSVGTVALMRNSELNASLPEFECEQEKAL